LAGLGMFAFLLFPPSSTNFLVCLLSALVALSGLGIFACLFLPSASNNFLVCLLSALVEVDIDAVQYGTYSL